MKIGKYKHYKGKFYQVIAIGRHTETLEELVIYRALYDDEEFGSNAIWLRPKSMFIETVHINGKELPRFEFVE